MIVRTLFLISCISLLGFLWPVPASAQGAWPVERSHSEISIDEDGQVEVVETIRVNYQENEVTGFDRSLPLKYTIDAAVSFVSIEVENVQRNGVDEPYTFHQGGEMATISIGDERLTLSGVQDYTITYLVKGILHHRGEDDLLYWKTVGGWEHEVQQATTTLKLPQGGIRDQYCEVYNSLGELQDNACQSVGLAGKTSKYVTSHGVETDGSMLIAAELEPGIVPISTVTPPTFGDWLAVYKKPLFGLGSVSVLCLLLAGGLWMRGRKSGEAAQKTED